MQASVFPSFLSGVLCVGFLVFVIPRLAGVSILLHTGMLELARVAPRFGISPSFLSGFQLSSSLGSHEVLEFRDSKDGPADGRRLDDESNPKCLCFPACMLERTDMFQRPTSPTHRASTLFSLRGITISTYGTRWPRYRIGQLFKIEEAGKTDRLSLIRVFSRFLV